MKTIVFILSLLVASVALSNSTHHQFDYYVDETIVFIKLNSSEYSSIARYREGRVTVTKFNGPDMSLIDMYRIQEKVENLDSSLRLSSLDRISWSEKLNNSTYNVGSKIEKTLISKQIKKIEIPSNLQDKVYNNFDSDLVDSYLQGYSSYFLGNMKKEIKRSDMTCYGDSKGYLTCHQTIHITVKN